MWVKPRQNRITLRITLFASFKTISSGKGFVCQVAQASTTAWPCQRCSYPGKKVQGQTTLTPKLIRILQFCPKSLLPPGHPDSENSIPASPSLTMRTVLFWALREACQDLGVNW